MLCSVCSPFSGHLYELLSAEKGVDGLTMTTDFCEEYVDECEGQISFEDDYCEKHTIGFTDTYWSYPYTAGESQVAAIDAQAGVCDNIGVAQKIGDCVNATTSIPLFGLLLVVMSLSIWIFDGVLNVDIGAGGIIPALYASIR